MDSSLHITIGTAGGKDMAGHQSKIDGTAAEAEADGFVAALESGPGRALRLHHAAAEDMIRAFFDLVGEPPSTLDPSWLGNAIEEPCTRRTLSQELKIARKCPKQECTCVIECQLS